MVEIPLRLPVSGRVGSERLMRLRRRANFLKQRVDSTDADRSFDKAERSALEWAIERIIVYEDQIKQE